MNLVLVGYRGSGKSTVGAVLAQSLGWRLVDLDTVVVQRAGRTIREIFDSEGEAGFRAREKEACRCLRKSSGLVVALGGGTVADSECRALVRRLGKVVYLRAPAVLLWSRISQDPATSQDRPDLTADGGLAEVETVLARREPMYRSVAHHTVDTISMTPRQIAESIELWFRALEADPG